MFLMDKKISQAIDTLAPLALGGLLTALRVSKVKWDQKMTSTACITVEGDISIYINPDFEKNHANTPEKLAGVLLHELMHKAIGITRYPPTLLWNIASDAYINAFLYKIHPRLVGSMESMYDKTKLPCSLLRPGSQVKHFELKDIYERLYNNLSSVGIAEIAEALLRAFPPQKFLSVVLIGSHPDQAIDQKTGKVIREAMASLGQKAGMGTSVFWTQVFGQETNSYSLQKALTKAAIQNIKGRIVSSLVGEKSPDKSVIPRFAMGRSEGIYYSLGVYPIFHAMPKENIENRSAIVYVDVSGSMNSYYSFIYGALQKLEGMLSPKCYMFSTIVNDLSKEDLRAGRIRTSYGTSFNCIAEHLLKNPAQKALIFTDGYARVSASNLRKLKESKIKLIGAIISDNKQSDLYKMCQEVIYVPPEVRRM